MSYIEDLERELEREQRYKAVLVERHEELERSIETTESKIMEIEMNIRDLREIYEKRRVREEVIPPTDGQDGITISVQFI